MLRFSGLTVVLFVAIGACANPEEVPDAGAPKDATTATRDGGVRDSGANAPRDAGVDEDGGTMDGGIRDGGGTPTDAAVDVCNAAFTLDGVVFGSIAATRVLHPTGTTPTTITRIEETGPFVAGALSRLSPAFEWNAQVSHLTAFDNVDYVHTVVDPNDGALYTVLEQQMQRDGTAIRIYNSDDSLATELVRDGTSGTDIVGDTRQSNFVLIKYDTNGDVQWVSRFGPNTPNGARAGTVQSIGLTANGVRVVARVEDTAQLVFAPGTASEFTYSASGTSAFWAEIAKSDGSYVANSFRRIEANDGQSTAQLNALGFAASASGETAIGGTLNRSGGTPTFTIGEGGADAITVTTTVSLALFTRVGTDGTPTFAATGRTLDARFAPDPRAIGLSSLGVMVGGGQFTGPAGTARFDSGGTTASLGYGQDDSFLVGFSPNGDLRWAKRIMSNNRNAVSRILVSDDGVYVMGVNGVGDVLAPDDANAFTITVAGDTISKYALDTGAFEWVRTFTGPTAGDAARAFDVWRTGPRYVVPTSFTALRVVGNNVDRVFSRPTANGLLGVVLFESNGDLVECQAASEGAFRFRAF